MVGDSEFNSNLQHFYQQNWTVKGTHASEKSSKAVLIAERFETRRYCCTASFGKGVRLALASGNLEHKTSAVSNRVTAKDPLEWKSPVAALHSCPLQGSLLVQASLLNAGYISQCSDNFLYQDSKIADLQIVVVLLDPKSVISEVLQKR